MAVPSMPAGPSTRRVRASAGPGATRGRPQSRGKDGSSPTASPPSAVHRERTTQRHEGENLLLVFVVATLIMVLAAVLVGTVGQWWVLVPVMLVDLTLTFVVLATLVGLLGDDDGRSR